ncbi:MAG: sensor histidine kinase, partial [Clostridia bacterium]|nr:sensor histidine kinase [Clostridia bacterium]
EKYCFLLKTRYQHRFEYTCEIDDSIKKAQLPKLTLQQLIENSIKHGFSNSSEIMRIKIDGWIEGDDVTICMQDNGQGFDQQTIEALNTKFFDLRQKLQSGGQIPNLEIGGMGLVNTYARLYLLYKDDLIFEVSNDGGAKISIGFRMNGEETKRDRQ